MKNIFLSSIVVFVSLFPTSCKRNSSADVVVGKEVVLNASILASSNSSVLSTTTNKNVWRNGDAIGVFMNKSGVSLTLPTYAENTMFVTDGSGIFNCFAPENKIFFPTNKENVDFIAYYPYKKTLSGLHYDINVANQTNLSDIDLLYSNNIKSVNSTNENFNLGFIHQLSKVVLKISHANSTLDFSNLTAKITNINTKGTFSLITGEIVDTSEPKDVDFYVDANSNLIEAILLPESDLGNKSLIVTDGTISYTYPLSGSSNISFFEKSKISEYCITLKNEDEDSDSDSFIEGVTATVRDWEIVSDSIDIFQDSTQPNPEDIIPTPTDSVDVEMPNDPNVGDGTKENPYTVNQAKELKSSTQLIWVKGYIVGGYESYTSNSKFTNIPSKASKATLALAHSKTDILPEQLFPINLLHKLGNNVVEDGVNIKDNPENLGKEISIMGYIDYFHAVYESLGLVGIKEAILDGVHYK